MIDHASVRFGDEFTFKTPRECDNFTSAQRNYNRRVLRTKVSNYEYRCIVYDPRHPPAEVVRLLWERKRRVAKPFPEEPRGKEWQRFYDRVGDLEVGQVWTLPLPSPLAYEDYSAMRRHLVERYPDHGLHFGPRLGGYIRISRPARD